MNQYAQSVGAPSEVAPGWDEWHSVVSPALLQLRARR